MKVSDDVLRLNPEHVSLLQQSRVKGQPRSPGSSSFRSKTERRVWEEWLPALDGLAVAVYEPFTLNLHVRGVKVRRYTPDLLLKFRSGDLWLVEIKGSWAAFQSGRASKIALVHAAVEYSWLAKFFVLTPQAGEWDLHRVAEKGGLDYAESNTLFFKP